jgi:hypothetical protein
MPGRGKSETGLEHFVLKPPQENTGVLGGFDAKPPICTGAMQ